MHSVTSDLIPSSILVVRRAFKHWRAKAIVYGLTNFAFAVRQRRVWPSVLQLGAMLVYMLNALIYRPGEQRWDGPLYTASAMWTFPHADGEDDVPDPFVNEKSRDRVRFETELH